MITQAQVSALCAEIAKLPVSLQQTKVSVMAAALRTLAAPAPAPAPVTVLPPPAPAPAVPPTPGFVTLDQLRVLKAQIEALPNSPHKTDLDVAYQKLALVYEAEEEAGLIANYPPPQSEALKAQIAASQVGIAGPAKTGN